ncbi:hypothetical protein [Aestuariivita sp.]|jgi:hypothetical protein|uniref:hypothetical protein n=1 Tax=Aestuariivita sp. TaxID=1872407 RepID=UPI00216E3C33|nr:hypothetical protein [Aestuariivita sp.]MCE8007132.1 hypothetical protein [Aestuariivita sp.]
MPKPEVLIQPGPFFYEVWAGAMKAQGLSVTKWANDHGFAIASIKPMATGGTNGEKSKKIRQLMLESVGEETFRALYEMRLRNAGLLK